MPAKGIKSHRGNVYATGIETEHVCRNEYRNAHGIPGSVTRIAPSRKCGNDFPRLPGISESSERPGELHYSFSSGNASPRRFRKYSSGDTARPLFSLFLSLPPFALAVVNPARTYLRMDPRVPVFPGAGPGEIMNEARTGEKRPNVCSSASSFPSAITVIMEERVNKGEHGVCYYFTSFPRNLPALSLSRESVRRKDPPKVNTTSVSLFPPSLIFHVAEQKLVIDPATRFAR